MDARRISVIIPALNEERGIGATLAAVRYADDCEIIVVDGGSTDRTRQLARNLGATVLKSPAGRALQMNRGAAVANGGILLFLHADTILPPGFDTAVRRCLAHPEVAAGAFRLAFDAPGAAYRLIAELATWRSVFLQTPYGDQGIFLRSSLFRHLGGYAEVPLLEDLLLVRRLKTLGNIVTLPQPAITSARRWTSNGPVRTTLFNQLILLGFRCGLSPARLARLYRNFARRQ